MLALAQHLLPWCRETREFAVATVMAARGSVPREVGAALAVDAKGTAMGSLSAGCVDAAIHDLCQEVLETGEPVVTTFGPAADELFAAGFTCGGEIDVLVSPYRVDPAVWRAALESTVAGGRTALVRAVSGGAVTPGRGLLVRDDGTWTGTLGGDGELDGAAVGEAEACLTTGRGGVLDVRWGGAGGSEGTAVRVFVECSVPPPRLVIFGAVDFGAALATMGRLLGYRVTVCDARAVFATAERFPDAHEVVVDWPHRYLDAQNLDDRAALCVLTHDPKFDVPLLVRALRLPVAYIGAMGSRAAHEDRVRRLREAGVSEGGLLRLRSPIGLDLGGRTPQETALSIVAEMVAVRRGGTGVPLAGGSGRIHLPSLPPITPDVQGRSGARRGELRHTFPVRASDSL